MRNAHNIFLHIPKTGGTYIAQYEGLRAPVLPQVLPLGHRVVTDVQDSFGLLDKRSYKARTKGLIRKKDPIYIPFEERTVFSVVRNPFTWLVSYAGHAGCWPTEYLNRSHRDYPIATKGFDYLVKTICGREDIWPSRRFLFCQLFSLQGRFSPNHILFNEDLDEGLQLFSKLQKLSYVKADRQRIGKRLDYRTMYTTELVDVVADAFERELELFGYEFETQSSCFGSILSGGRLAHLSYNWDTDVIC